MEHLTGWRALVDDGYISIGMIQRFLYVGRRYSLDDSQANRKQNFKLSNDRSRYSIFTT